MQMTSYMIYRSWRAYAVIFIVREVKNIVDTNGISYAKNLMIMADNVI